MGRALGGYSLKCIPPRMVGRLFLRVFLLVLMYVCMCIACVFSPVFVYSSSVAFAIMVGLLGFYHVRPELLTCEFTQLHFLSISRPPFCSSVSKVLQYICNPRLFRFTFSSQWLMSLLWLMYPAFIDTSCITVFACCSTVCINKIEISASPQSTSRPFHWLTCLEGHELCFCDLSWGGECDTRMGRVEGWDMKKLWKQEYNKG